jgi:hypothetical protein
LQPTPRAELCEVGVIPALEVRDDGAGRIIHVRKDQRRGQPQGSDAAFKHPYITPLIALGAISEIVTAAIDFDREPRRLTVEVEDVRSNGVLLAELQPFSFRPLIAFQSSTSGRLICRLKLLAKSLVVRGASIS